MNLQDPQPSLNQESGRENGPQIEASDGATDGATDEGQEQAHLTQELWDFMFDNGSYHYHLKRKWH